MWIILGLCPWVWYLGVHIHYSACGTLLVQTSRCIHHMQVDTEFAKNRLYMYSWPIVYILTPESIEKFLCPGPLVSSEVRLHCSKIYAIQLLVCVFKVRIST